MDKYIDDLTKRWMFSKRGFPSPVPVRTIGWLPGKTHWNHREHKGNLAFSFLVKGQGELRIEDKVHKLKSPCMFICYPWKECTFGPTGPDGSWDEFYLSYMDRKSLFAWSRRRAVSGLKGMRYA